MSELSQSIQELADAPCREQTAAADDTRSGIVVWLLVGYMWIFIHRPFEIWPTLAAIRIERMYMIATIACWLVSGPSLPRGNRLHQRFAGFILVMLASWYLSPFQSAGDKTIEIYLKYCVFYVIFVTSVRNERALRTLLVGHLCVLTLLMAHSLREYGNGRLKVTQGIARLLPVGVSYDFNDFAGLIVCVLPLAWILWRTSGARWMQLALLGYGALSSYCVMLTGSRMGFVGLIMAAMLGCIASPRRRLLIALCPVLLASVWTILPQDRKDRYLTLIDPSSGNRSATASASNLRLAGFQKSLPLFAERPLFGFGPMSFKQASGSATQPHNLYGQLLAELGIAGFSTFSLILWGVGKNAYEARRLTRERHALRLRLHYQTIMGASASFVLLAFMSWGFNFLFWHVWLWFGAFQVVALRLLKEQVAYEQWVEECEILAEASVFDRVWT